MLRSTDAKAMLKYFFYLGCKLWLSLASHVLAMFISAGLFSRDDRSIPPRFKPPIAPGTGPRPYNHNRMDEFNLLTAESILDTFDEM